MEIPAWLCGPLVIFSGPFAVVFIMGFVSGYLTARR